MQRLLELIQQLDLVTVAETNAAIFAHPGSGLIEALGKEFGEERAESILAAVADELKIPLLSGEEVRLTEVPESISHSQLSEIVSRYRALPLRVTEELVVLAMADPLDQEAIKAFVRFFGVPAQIQLAREKHVREGLEVFLVQSRESQNGVRAPLIVEDDPDVTKAIQQVIATAVKHGAAEVEIALDNPFTEVHFYLSDDTESSVEISVDPYRFAASLIRQSQIIEKNNTSFSAIARVEFKTVCVNCQIAFHNDFVGRHVKESDSHTQHGSGIVISQFLIDAPDNPLFWVGISPRSFLSLHRIFEHQSGLVIVSGQDRSTRNLVLRSLSESYSHLRVVEHSEDLVQEKSLFEGASQTTTLVGVDAENVFQVIEQLESLLPRSRKMIRGILAFQQLPRNCNCCDGSYSPGPEELQELPNYLCAQVQDYREGKGCPVCLNSGYLGELGVCSVFDLSGSAGKSFQNGASTVEVFSSLAFDEFDSLFENGLQLAISGQTRLDMVLERIAHPPAQYEAAIRDSVRVQTLIDSAEPLQVQQHIELPEVFDSNSEPDFAFDEGQEPDNQPVRGAAAFYVKKNGAEEVESWNDEGEEDLELSEPEVLNESDKTLLVIEDDPDQRAILRRMFELAGYNVEVAADGIDGVVTASRLEPSLIIVDFMMPDIDGRETIRRLRNTEQTKKTPIVALTAYANSEVEEGMMAAGANDFCPKSISKRLLLKRVERLIRDTAA